MVYLVNDPVRIILGLTALGALVSWYGVSYTAWRSDILAIESQQGIKESLEYERRMTLLTGLRDYYRLSSPWGTTFELASPQAWPPAEWMNMQLAQRGETWWVTLDGDKIEFSN